MSDINDLNTLEIAANQRIKERTYWLAKLAGECGKSHFPYDSAPHSALERNMEKTGSIKLEPALCSLLNKICGSVDIKINMLLTAALVVLIHKYCYAGRDDIVVGAPIFKHAAEKRLLNTVLILRNHVSTHMTFKELLLQLKQTYIEATENQSYPVDILARQLNRPVSVGEDFTLFDTSLLLRNIQDEDHLRHTRHNMMFSFLKSETGIEAEIHYNSSLYRETTIRQITRHFIKLLGDVLSNLNIKLFQIELLSPAETNRLLVEFNDTRSPYDRVKPIHGLIEDQAARTPFNIALQGRGGVVPTGKKQRPEVHLTYRLFNERANQLARLLQSKAVGPHSIVAIILEPCVEIMIAILAVIKSGAAYLPIDPRYPEDRVSYILKDSNSALLLTQKSHNDLQEPLFAGEIIYLDNPETYIGKSANLESLNPLADLAYIIYTSGSTGRPKGVMVEHRNLLAYVHAFFQEFEITADDTVIQQASLAFDAFVEEVYPVLLRGGKLVIPSTTEIIDAKVLAAYMARNRVNLISCSPLLLNELNKQQGLDAVHTFINGGDVLKENYIDNLIDNGQVYNTYGPTETTVCVTYYKCRRRSSSNIPIGKPIANYTVLILNENNNLVPIGVTGELCVLGDGVSRGYLNNPQLTSEKFVVNHVLASHEKNHDRFYRTGDLARWLQDGNIQLLGRSDQQVKIRGYRIELGEIENRLLEYDGIYETVVKAIEEESGEKNLCAYFVYSYDEPVDSSPSLIQRLRDFLSVKFPDYLVPAYFMKLNSIPLTPSGKVAQRLLPAPEKTGTVRYMPPQDQWQQDLVDIWADVLDVDKEILSIDENFFALGGHSLKATVAISEINKHFNINVPLGELFKRPTIKGLAQYIANDGLEYPLMANINDDNLLLLKPGNPGSAHFFIIHDGTGEVEGYIELSNHLTQDFNYWGIRADRLKSGAPINCTIRQLARKYVEKIQKLQPQGPYYILGWSLGGTIAFEIAAQLEQNKEDIAFLSLVDSPPPTDAASEGSAILEFNLQSELDFIKGYSLDPEIRENLGHTTGLEQFWSVLLHHLEAADTDVEIIKQAIHYYGLQALPNFDHLDLKEAVYYLNVGRTFHNARQIYSPTEKINTPVHYVAAAQSKEIINHFKWNQFTTTAISSYQITGDHLSIFKEPHVSELAKQLDIMLENM